MYLSNIEFYNSPEGDVMVKESGKAVRELLETDRPIIEALLMLIKDRYTEAFNALSELYTKNERNRFYYEYKIVHRFIRCNFGEYDQYKYDIDQAGNLNFEEVRCPFRGECPHEEIICKPKINNNLTTRELEVFKYIGFGLQSADIANELKISVATVNRHRENIKAKLGLKTIGELVNHYNTYFKHE